MGSTPDGGILPETRRVTMDEATIVKGYQYAKDIYGRAGVDVDRAIELADRIAAFKPLRAVSGNIDGGMTRRVYPAFQAFECERVQVLMTHIGGYPRHYDPRAVQKIQSVHPKLFIAGHSHILKVIYDPVYDLLHVNPGAAGEFGFHKVRTAVRLTIDGAEMRDMEVGEWPRS